MVSASDVARIPVGNLRVRREEFVAVWTVAEERDREQGRGGVLDWYAGGVVATCRWLATAPTEDQMGRRYPSYAPASGHNRLAYEELIEAEYQAAELLDVRQPELLVRRPGWCEAIRATLRWAWRREGPPPLPLPVGVSVPAAASGGSHGPPRS
jgi:hypothetical protein